MLTDDHAKAQDESVTDHVLPVVRVFCDALARAEIRYCHWKSNDMLARTESGDNDLDVLIHADDAEAFMAILQGLSFKEADGPPARRVPGVTHLYGMDPSGKLINVHAHFALVVGDDTTKNYRVPFEEPYLASAQKRGIFPVPDPAFELVVFVIRMVLKHGAPDVIPFGKGTLGGAETRELADLLTRTDAKAAAAVVDQHLPFIGRALWLRCLDSLQHSQADRVRAAVSLQRALRPHGRHGMLVDAVRKVTRRSLWGAKRFVLKRKTKKVLFSGGRVIAIVGGDGAGKSTAVNAVTSWLSSTFQTELVHLGKPPKSFLTLAVKGLMLTLVRLGVLPQLKEEVRAAAGDERTDIGAPWALWHLMTARDRARAFRRAKRVADRGGIVVCDRFPLPWIRLMDGTRATRLAAQNGASRLTRALGALERRSYESLGLPDILIVLRLDPEVAVVRKAGVDEPTYVRKRNEEIFTAAWDETPALVVDASQPADEVFATIRKLVWERL